MEYKQKPWDRVNQKGILNAPSKYALKKIVSNELGKFNIGTFCKSIPEAKKHIGRTQGIQSIGYKILELAEQRYLELTQSEE